MEAITMNISTRSRRISRTVQWARSHKWMIELADPGLQAQCKSYKDGKKIINPWNFYWIPALSLICWQMLTTLAGALWNYWKIGTTNFLPAQKQCVKLCCILIIRCYSLNIGNHLKTYWEPLRMSWTSSFYPSVVRWAMFILVYWLMWNKTIEIPVTILSYLMLSMSTSHYYQGKPLTKYIPYKIKATATDHY